MIKFIFYPKCTTCQKAQKWLEQNGIAYELRNIKEDKPTADELKLWQQRSGRPMRKFFNTSGMLYRSMGLKDKLADMSDEERTELLSTDGMLVKRPIAVSEDAVLIGFKEAEWEQALKG